MAFASLSSFGVRKKKREEVSVFGQDPSRAVRGAIHCCPVPAARAAEGGRRGETLDISSASERGREARNHPKEGR